MRQAPSARDVISLIFFSLFNLALVGGLLWANLHFAQRQAGGMAFLSLWKGAQNFVYQELDNLNLPYSSVPLSVEQRKALQGFSILPYGDYTALQIQRMVYGRLLRPGEYPMYPDQPFYLFPFYFPFGAIRDFTTARAVWMLFQQGALVLAALFSIRLAKWSSRPPVLALIVLFVFLWFPSMFGLVSGSPVIFLVLLLTGALFALEKNADELTGALLVLATFYLESGLPLLIFILLWSAFSSRWRVWGGFLMTLIVLGMISFILDSSWFWPFARAVYANLRDNPFPSTFHLFETWFPGIGERMGWFLSVGTAGMLLYEWIVSFRRDFRWMYWTASLTLAATPLLGMPVQPFNLVMLVPSLLLVFSVILQRWGILGRWLVTIFMVGLFALLWLLAFQGTVDTIFLWLCPLTIMLLYWIRWWQARPARLWADQMADNERPRFVPR